MNNNESNKRFGFNLKPDLSEYNKKEEKPAEGEEKAESAEKKSDGEDVAELVKLATVGMVNKTWELVVYLVLWYFCYPTLLFTTFYMAQKYMNGNFEIFTPLEALNAFITLSSGMYYAYYLLTTFINEHSDPHIYAAEKQFFIPRIAYYALFMGFVLYTSNMLNLETLQNAEIRRLFIIFYLLYFTAVSVFKHFNNKVSRPH